MTYEEIKKRYNYLTSAELEAELKYRTTHRTSTWMLGAECCDINLNLIMACRELLSVREKMR